MMAEPIPITLDPRLHAASDAMVAAFREHTGHFAVLRAIVPHGLLPDGLGEVLLRSELGECAFIDERCFEELRAETDARLREVPP